MANLFEEKQESKITVSKFFVGYTTKEYTEDLVTYCNTHGCYVEKQGDSYTIRKPVVTVTEEEARNRRNKLLADTDHYLLYDQWPKFTNEQQQKILTYRDALRTLTLQPTFPKEITWPTLSL